MEKNTGSKRNYRGSLTRYLLYLLLSVTLLPLISVAVLEYFNAKQALIEGRERQLTALNDLLANELHHYYRTIADKLPAYADQASLLPGAIGIGWKETGLTLSQYINTPAYRKILAEQSRNFTQSLQDYPSVLITDTAGNVLFARGVLKVEGENIFTQTDLSKTSLAQAVRNALKPGELQYAQAASYKNFIKYQHKSKGTSTDPALHDISFFVTPLLADDNKPLGTLAIGINALHDTRQIAMQKSKLAKQVDSYLVDKQQQVHHISVASDHFLKATINVGFPFMQRWLNNGLQLSEVSEVSQYKNYDGINVLGVAQTLDMAGASMLLVTEVPENEALSSITDFRNHVLILLSLIIIMVTGIVFLLACYISHPVRRMIEWTRQISEGNHVQATALPYNNEIGELSHGFAVMVEKLHETREDNLSRIWLQQGIIELDNILRMEEVPSVLAENALNWLCQYTEIAAGEIWFCGTDTDSIVSGSAQYLLATTDQSDDIKQCKYIHRLPLINQGQTKGELILLPAQPLSILQQSFLEMAVKPLAISLCHLQLQYALKKSSQYKSEFLANISHELRTPLHSILMLSQVMKENTSDNLTIEQQQSASTINKVGHDLLYLINDILDLSRVEAGQLEIIREKFNIHSILKTLEVQFKAQAKNKGLKFSMHCSLQNTLINTDKHRLVQILQNLLGNAIKFTEKGQVELRVDNTPAGEVEFSVSDTGIGIAEDKQAMVFHPFGQAGTSDNFQHGGTGLGLSVSRHLAALLDGNIRLKSEIGKGSVFTLSLPCSNPALLVREQGSGQSIFISDDQPEQYNRQFNDLSILLINNDLRESFYISGVLEGCGIKIKIAHNPQLVEEKLKATANIDLILADKESLDQMSPLEEIQGKSIPPVIILSPENSTGLNTGASSPRVNNTIYTPCSLRNLLEKINDCHRSNRTK